MQDVLNSCFSRSASTEQALLLLRQFEGVLQSDSLRADLEAKYAVAFQGYAADLEAVVRIYEKHKAEPPCARNVPPTAGCILWARHLLHRIEGPMQHFKALPTAAALLAAKESKRGIRTYNRLAQTLMEFEAMWHRAWLHSVDEAKAQLQATLLTQHPDTGKRPGWAPEGRLVCDRIGLAVVDQEPKRAESPLYCRPPVCTCLPQARCWSTLTRRCCS